MNLLCKGKHVGGLTHFDIALYDEDQGVDFYSSGKQRSRESKQPLYSVFCRGEEGSPARPLLGQSHISGSGALPGPNGLVSFNPISPASKEAKSPSTYYTLFFFFLFYIRMWIFRYSLRVS